MSIHHVLQIGFTLVVFLFVIINLIKSYKSIKK